MKKKLCFTVALQMFGQVLLSQVGINNLSPQATLDISAKYPTGNNNKVEGLIIPRVDRERANAMINIPTSTLIYVNDVSTGNATGIAVNINAVGYYYFNGSLWIKLNEDVAAMITNIYNANGTLEGDRIVTQGNKKIAFTGNSVNAFSIDGNTFSVDAQNDKVGIGIENPSAKLHIMGSQILDAVSDSNSANAIDINIGRDGLDYGNRTNNYGINIRTLSSIHTGNVARINFGDTSTVSNNGNRYLSFSVGKNLNELMYLEDKEADGGRVGIGTTSPNNSAILELSATNKGFLPPRLTTAQRNALIHPIPEGLIIYNITHKCLEFWNSSSWVTTCANTKK